ncbi:DUF5937 family protein [Streptomyces sp. NL15-2K]|uniref:ArsR/SmtB family transcription factor n=1 Tax=Streptomyces sp. NL15-2K TaxID=376149 RepID=UPI000F57E525|nr:MULTISPECIES: DUF5937 family protein [Actinomycetes]WKX08756.1 DUF5937 family protein [Kutzneria buriramensis]GCB49755.1 hypothetical protein SNL152K_7097 [Streptomyces sp. NL15-2K]
MATRLHFDENDLLNCRFAISPLWEAAEAVQMLKRPDRQAYQRPWLRRNRGTVTTLELTPLWLLMPECGPTPGWLCPPLNSMAATFEEEIAAVRATDPDIAREDALHSLSATPGALDAARDRAWLKNPARMIRQLTDLLEKVWHHLIEPDWPQLRALLEADISFHLRRLAENGLGGLFSEISSNCVWHAGTLTVEARIEYERHLHGQGLVLMPSVFIWPQVIGAFKPPGQPTLAYPARGIVDLWDPAQRTPDNLTRLLGRGRAAVLAALDAPDTTASLAKRLKLAPSSVSSHLTVLREAGLLTARRYGRHVMYEQTSLGGALTAGG